MDECGIGGRQLERGGADGGGAGDRRGGAQGGEDALAGAAVGRLQAQAGLLDLDGAAGGAADHAVGLADQVAASQQQLLQFAPFGAAKAGVVGGPCRDQAGAAAQAVCEQRDR